MKFVSKVVVESIRFEGKGYNMPTLATGSKIIRADSEWSGNDFVKQSEALAR